ncbi:MAG: pyridoxal phosphate-dependent aminotransferase [Acidobacteria bacterium]|nr:pyridoxal phosphate-dependent aminotransferase [Acidobacteriota bacterium]
MDSVNFSQRTFFEPATSDLAQAIGRRMARNQLLYDLTTSNPGSCGLTPNTEKTLSPLQTPAAMYYNPNPRGILSAREAVAALYNNAVSPERIFLAASTSEAYSMLFRLLCDPRDQVLIPQPGYPLFDMLAALDNVTLQHYPLFYDHGWHIDLASLVAAITLRTRAILLVHPNNPTGHYTTQQERAALSRIAITHNLALIVDEVFLEYPIESEAGNSFTQPGEDQPLIFTLSGLSKICALPQMKLAWTTITGPAEAVAEATHRLDLIADTFLSVATPQQLALPTWLADRREVQSSIIARVKANLAELDRQIANTAISRLPVQAGWAAVLRVPATLDDTDLALQLVREAGVAVHPGSFYGFPPKGWLVISLLIDPQHFAAGINLLGSGIQQVNPT